MNFFHRSTCLASSCWLPYPLPPCMWLLPLVEMFCRWELEEDCTSLHALMVRFDSELEWESHELGRSLLAMVRDEDEEYLGLPPLESTIPISNPFEEVRGRLEAAHLAIRELHMEAHTFPYFSSMLNLLWLLQFDLQDTPCLVFNLSTTLNL